MTETASPATNRLSRIRRYRRLMFGWLLAGVVVALLLRTVGYPLLGEVVYWLGVLGFLAVWWGTPVTLFDERDAALERRASHVTLLVAAVVLVVGASAMRVLPLVSDVVVPAAVQGALYGLAGLFVVFAAAYIWLRFRP